MPSSRLSSFFLTDRLIASHPQKNKTACQSQSPLYVNCCTGSAASLKNSMQQQQHSTPTDTMHHHPEPSSCTTTPHGMSPSSTSASLPQSRASSTHSIHYAPPSGPTATSSQPRSSSDLLTPTHPTSAGAAVKHRPKPLQIATQPRDDPQRAISAPLVTAFAMDSLLKSPQLNQRCTLPSGRVVSYAVCGAKQGKPVVYFYGLGGSRRQLALLHSQALRLGLRVYCMDRPGTGHTQILSKKQRAALRERAQARTQQQRQHLQQHQQQNEHEQQDLTAAEGTINKAKKHKRSRSSNISSSSSRIAGLASSLFFSSTSSSSSSDHLHQQPPEQQQQLHHHAPSNAVLERIDEVCHEVIDWLDIVLDKSNNKHGKSDSNKPPTKVSLMSHSCGVYYVMRMLALYPDRVKAGPVGLLTPWVPFNECPTTTSNTFKAVRYVPRGLVWAFTSSFNHLGSALLPATNALSDSIASTANMIGESSSPSFMDRRPGSPVSPQSPMSPFPPSPCPSSILGMGLTTSSRPMSLSSNSLASLTSLTMPGAAFTSSHPHTILQQQDVDGYVTPPFPATPPFVPVPSSAAAAATGLAPWNMSDIPEGGRDPPSTSSFAEHQDAAPAARSSKKGNDSSKNSKGNHRLSFLSLNGGVASQLVRGSFETVTSTVSNITGFCTRRATGEPEKRRNSYPGPGGRDTVAATTMEGHNKSKSKKAKKMKSMEKVKHKKEQQRQEIPTVEIERPKDPFLEPFKEAVEKVALPAMLEDLNRQHSRGYNLEIQLCISDAGFTLDSVAIPPGVEIHAYCGHQDKMVPLEASREMAQKCGWKVHEFLYSGHGGPRMLMTALEDLALADPS